MHLRGRQMDIGHSNMEYSSFTTSGGCLIFVYQISMGAGQMNV